MDSVRIAIQKAELHKLYAKSSSQEVKLYALHKELSNNTPVNKWDEREQKIFTAIQEKKKLEKLINKNKDTNITSNKETYIKNLSQNDFTKEELDLLNKGLKFSLSLRKAPIEDIIVDIQAGLWKENHETKFDIKTNTANIIKRYRSQKIPIFTYSNTIKKLKEKKNVLFMKANKGNTTVNMDKEDYKKKEEKLIKDRTYVKLTL